MLQGIRKPDKNTNTPKIIVHSRMHEGAFSLYASV